MKYLFRGPSNTLFSVASSLSPEDGEIAFNLAAVLEACGQLEEALEQYRKSKEFGVDRAAMHMRNVSPGNHSYPIIEPHASQVSAKILGKKLKEAEGQQGKDESSA